MRLHDIGLPLWTSLALVFALTTGGPFPWFLFYCLAGALVLSGLWAYHASRNVDCSATVDRAAATAGEVVELRLELENRSLLPVPRVLVANGAARPEDGEGTGTGDGAAAGQRVTYLGLGPLATFIDRRRIRLDRRGRYRLGPIVVEAQDPLGIFRIRRVVHAEPELTVYPRPAPVRELPIVPRQPFGRQPTRIRAWQDPSSLNDVRPFRLGDNPKHIHWKLSARFGDLYVKEFDLRATTDIVVFIDLDRRVQAG